MRARAAARSYVDRRTRAVDHIHARHRERLRLAATEDEVIAWYMRGVLDRARGDQCEAQRVRALDRSSIIRRRFEKLGLPRRSQYDGHCGG